MLNIIIKHFFIYICCIYIYRHLQNNHTRNNFEIPISIVFSFSLALFTAIVKDFFPTFVNILPIIILWIAHSITSSQPKVSFITTIIAFAISYGLFVFSSFSIVLFLAPLRFSISLDLPAYITLMSGVLEIILFLFLIRKKKISSRYAFPLLKKIHKYRNHNMFSFLCNTDSYSTGTYALTISIHTIFFSFSNCSCISHLLVAGAAYQVLSPQATALGTGISA